MKRAFWLVLAAMSLVSIRNGFAGTYYIGPNGDYPSLNAFKSAVPAPANGSDVYFECGNTFVFTSQWSINWQGTAADRAMVGSFFYLQGRRTLGISGSKPVISGDNNTYPPGDYAYPSQAVWAGLINIYDKDYVTVQNLVITQSRGLGLKIGGEQDNPAVSAQYFVVDHCDFTDNYMSALQITYCENNYGVVSDNYVYNNVLAGNQKLKLFGSHPVTVVVVGSPNANTVFERNQLLENWGETLGVNSRDFSPGVHASHVTFRDNVMYARVMPGIYCDGASNIDIYRNMIVGRNYCGATVPDTFCMAGIGINNETYPEGEISPYNNYQSSAITIYNNLIANGRYGVAVGDETAGNVVDGIKIFNNTFIAVYIPLRKMGSGFVNTNCEWKNNISYCPPGAVCSTENQFVGAAGWTFANNAGYGPAYGSNYVMIAQSDMVDPYGPEWQDITLAELLGSPVTAGDFNITPNSKAINAGVAIPLVQQDYFKTARPQGAAHDIGAHEYLSSPGAAPLSPEGLVVK